MVFFFPKVVSNTTQCHSVEDNCPEEVVILLRIFSRHRDQVLRAQLSDWIAVAHIVYLSEIGGYL